MVNKKSKPTKAVGTKTQTNTTVEAPVMEAPVKKTINPFGKKVDRRPITYSLIPKNKNKRGQDQFPIVYMLRAEDVVFDPNTNQQRQIRYIPGQLSIFADEQDEKAIVKAPITFNNGFLMVEYTNPNLRKFLDMCNANSNNPNRRANAAPAFRKIDHEANAQKNLKKSMKVLAEKDPEGFLKGLDDPKVEVKQTLLRAKEAGLIALGKSEVTWIKGDQRPVIRHVPLGVEPLDCLAEFCLTQDGDAVLQQIKIQLDIKS